MRKIFPLFYLAVALVLGDCSSSLDRYAEAPTQNFTYNGSTYTIRDAEKHNSLYIIAMLGAGDERSIVEAANAFLAKAHPGCVVSDRFRVMPDMAIYDFSYRCK